jgi:hypothetical protein
MARRQGNYARAKIDRDRWAVCPNCGSIKVKTCSDVGFVPTNASIVVAATPPQQGVRPTQDTPGDDPRVPTFSGDEAESANPVNRDTAGGAAEASGRLRTSSPGFWAQHWQIVVAILFLVAPIGSFSSDQPIYTGPVGLDVVKVIVIFAVCWTAAGLFSALYWIRRSGRHGLQ